VIAGGTPENDHPPAEAAAAPSRRGVGGHHACSARYRGPTWRWYRSYDVLVCSLVRAVRLDRAGGHGVRGARGGDAVSGLADGGVRTTGTLVPVRDRPRSAGTTCSRPVRRLGYATAGVDRVRRQYSWDFPHRLADLYQHTREGASARPTSIRRGGSAVGERASPSRRPGERSGPRPRRASARSRPKRPDDRAAWWWSATRAGSERGRWPTGSVRMRRRRCGAGVHGGPTGRCGAGASSHPGWARLTLVTASA
jgi:hypothetical protein